MKKIKTHIIKFSAIAISMIYLLMPIHKEIKSVLHSLSHYIEMPEVILSHNHYENLNFKSEKSASLNHEHKIIDILDYFTDENTNHGDSNIPNVKDIDVDKHFHSPKYIELKLVSVKISLASDTYRGNVKDPFYWKIKVPPRTL